MHGRAGIPIKVSLISKSMPGFPGGTVVENPPANAGDTGSSPGLGRSHMPRSNWAREPQLLSLRVWSLCSPTRGRDSERPAHRDEEWPPLAAIGGSPRTETKTQHSQKKKKVDALSTVPVSSERNLPNGSVFLFCFVFILKNLNNMMNSVGNSLPGAIRLLIRALRLTLDHDSGKPFL